MDIIIVGDGKVGHALSEHLCQENHQITIIDSSMEKLNSTADVLDVSIVRGNGASMDTQKEANVGNADLLIATTSGDEINMVCCLVAKKLGVKNTIARIRNPEYQTQMRMFESEFNLSLSINPEYAAAVEISRLIRLPSALQIDSFIHNRVDLIEFKVQKDSALIGSNVKTIANHAKARVLVCAIERNGSVIIPKGETLLQEADRIHITGQNKEIQSFLRRVGSFEPRIHSVMILGGGKITYYLAKMLENTGINIKIIEINEARCKELADSLPEATIIHGDGTDQELLESEGLETMGAFVALSNMDEENIIASMIALQSHGKKVITKVNRMNYIPILDYMQIESVISPKLLTVDQILRYVRAMENTAGNAVYALHKIANEQAEALEFRVDKTAHNLQVPLSEVSLRENALIAFIARGNRLIVPDGQDSLQENDHIIVVTTIEGIDSLNDIFE